MKNFLKTHHKKIILITLSFVILLIGVIILKGIPKGDPANQNLNSKSASKAEQEEDPKNCKSNPEPVFTHPFIDLTKIDALGPLGAISGGSTGRSYMDVKGSEKDGVMAPIFSPMDATLETIIWAPRGPDTPPEYGLYFRVSCEVTYLFDHLDELSDEIKKYAPKEPAKNTATEAGTKPNVVIKAGTPLAKSNGTVGGGTFDFLLMNDAKEAYRINPVRWTWYQTNYASCPYDYFTPELKSQYYAKIGILNYTGFVKAKDCGSSSEDVAGTISGGWFKGSSTNSTGDYLGIGERPDSIDIVIRKDNRITSSVRDWNSKIAPKTIIVGKNHCYFDSTQSKWAFVNLIEEKKLSIAFGTGSCPSVFPTSQAEIWER